MDESINTVLLNLPTTVKAFVRENPDASYTIILNARLTREQQETAYNHELEHIKNNDFDTCCPADEIEQRRHK